MRLKILFILLVGLSSVGIWGQTPTGSPQPPADYRGPVVAPDGPIGMKIPSQISGGVLNGKAKSLPKPTYPAAALAANVTGMVTVQVVIDEAGNVVSAKAVNGHGLLRDESEIAAMQARFSPTTLQGNPVKVSGVITYNFHNPKSTHITSDVADNVWALGAFFSIIRANDADVTKRFGDLEDLLKVLPNDLPPAFEPERLLFERLASANGSERVSIVEELRPKLREKLTADQAWQIDIGELAGDTMVEILRFAIAVDKGVPFDPALLKEKLAGIKTMAEKAPDNTPSDLKERFLRVGKFASDADLGRTRESIIKLMTELQPIFDKL